MFVQNIEKLTKENTNFRKVIYTGEHSQIVVMSLDLSQEIGEEIHRDVDQIIFITTGEANATINGEIRRIGKNDVIFVPAGMKHNVKNIGSVDLKLFTVYSPPEHLDEEIHAAKEEVIQTELK